MAELVFESVMLCVAGDPMATEPKLYTEGLKARAELPVFAVVERP